MLLNDSGHVIWECEYPEHSPEFGGEEQDFSIQVIQLEWVSDNGAQWKPDLQENWMECQEDLENVD